MKKHYFIFLVLFLVISTGGVAQELNFEDYEDYSLTVNEVTSDDLHFGQVLSGSGTYTIGITNAKEISIKGIEYLDVIVDVDAPNSLYLDGNPGYAGNSSKTIPFTLKASFANNKGIPDITQRKVITGIINNSFTRQFRILARQHQPPGPPPDPPSSYPDYAKLKETAHLYLYGDIDVGNVDPGFYSGNITISVFYN